MRRLLWRTSGSPAEVARVLGISRAMVWHRLGQLGMRKAPAEVRAALERRFRLL